MVGESALPLHSVFVMFHEVHMPSREMGAAPQSQIPARRTI